MAGVGGKEGAMATMKTSTRATEQGVLVEFNPEQFAPSSVLEVLEGAELSPAAVIRERPGYGTFYAPAIIRLSRMESGGGDHPNAAWVARLASALLLVPRIDRADGEVRVDVNWRRTPNGRQVDFTLQISPNSGIANLDEALQIVADVAQIDPLHVSRVVASLTGWGSVSVFRGAA